jgi:hypothetical protein
MGEHAVAALTCEEHDVAALPAAALGKHSATEMRADD